MKKIMINLVAILVIGIGGISLSSPQPANAAANASFADSHCKCSNGSTCSGDCCSCTDDGCTASDGGISSWF